MTASKSGGMHFATVSFSHSTAVQFIPSLKVHFIPPPQTQNGHTKKGTGFLIPLLGGATAKWLQIGAVLTFLSNTPSLIYVDGNFRGVFPI